MKRAAIIFISLMLLLCMTACGNGPGQDDSNGSNTESDATEAETGYGNIGDDRTTINNVLVVYFSATGTTKQIAGYAADIVPASYGKEPGVVCHAGLQPLYAYYLRFGD